jgi:hypothetical protein
MILFSFDNYAHMALHLQRNCGISARQFTIARYENQELHAPVHEPLSGERNRLDKIMVAQGRANILH